MFFTKCIIGSRLHEQFAKIGRDNKIRRYSALLERISCHPLISTLVEIADPSSCESHEMGALAHYQSHYKLV